MNRKTGFTLIELLVVVAVIAVLISLLLPSLGAARETAKGVVCMSNLKQMSFGIQRYVDDNNSVMHISYDVNHTTISRWWSWTLYSLKYFPAAGTSKNNWSQIMNCPTAENLAFGNGTPQVYWTYLRMSNSDTFWEPSGLAGWYRMPKLEDPSGKIFLFDGQLLPGYGSDTGDLFEGCAGVRNGGYLHYGMIVKDQSHDKPYSYSGGAGFIHNGRANALFADWHVQSFRWGDVPQHMCDVPSN